jgi:hypothetical protein
MIRTIGIRTLLSAALAASAASSFALVYNLSGVLLGSKENPPRDTPATGTLSGTYDDATNQLHIMVEGSDFVANLTGGHIHTGGPAVNGPILVHLMNMSGSSIVWMSDDTFTLSDASEVNLLAGNLYVNLHTTTYPGGEIRSQIDVTPVPEPASLAVLGLGLLAIRKRRR